MSAFVVRPGRPDDLEARVDLYIEVAGEGRWIGGELPLDRDGLLELRRDSLEDPNVAVWVAEAEGVVVGELTLVVRRGRADLGMEIASPWRGRGIGTALMEAAIAWARAQGLDKISLEVWPHNQAAIALYQKMGFAREGYHPKEYRRKSGEAWDAVSMGLVL